MATIHTKLPGVTREATTSLAGLMPAADKADRNAEDLIDNVIQETLRLDFANGVYRRRTAVTTNNYALQKIPISNLASLLNFTRSSIGTYYDAKGILRTAASGESRWDYDPITGECKGLLIEEGRTNKLLYSEDFTQGDWIKTRASITSNAATAPDGNTTADKLVEDTTASNTHQVYQNESITDGVTVTGSIYIKPAERSVFQMLVPSGNITFDLINHSTSNISTNVTDYEIIACKNGWYRCYLTATSDGSTKQFLLIRLALDGGSSVYDGDGSSGIYIWGAQLEEGAFPTSYIPTTSAQGTRGAEEMYLDTSTFPDIYRDDEGTFFVEMYKDTNNMGYALYVDDSGGGNEFLGIFVNDTNESTTLRVVDGYGDIALDRGKGFNSSIKNRVAAGLERANYAYFTNAEGLSSSSPMASEYLPESFERMFIGSDSVGGNFMNGHISSITYYPRRLADDKLQAFAR